MKSIAMVTVLLGAGLASAGTVQAGPQYDSNQGTRSYLVRCESSDNRLHRCPLAGDVNVRLARKLSDSPCTEGRTWGYDRQSIWVTEGCRGDFAANPGYRDSAGPGGGGWQGGNAQTIRCESSDGRYRQCSANSRGRAQLVRQLSSARCVEGQTWGSNRDGIWVDKGCRGEFSVGGGRGNGRGEGWGNGRGNGNGNNDVRTLRCESNDNRTQRCAADVRNGVRLVRQLSDNACVQGRSWGWDRSGVWVSSGCRAEFSVN